MELFGASRAEIFATIFRYFAWYLRSLFTIYSYVRRLSQLVGGSEPRDGLCPAR